jgi:hypothetical protein
MRCYGTLNVSPYTCQVSGVFRSMFAWFRRKLSR